MDVRDQQHTPKFTVIGGEPSDEWLDLLADFLLDLVDDDESGDGDAECEASILKTFSNRGER
jgi:hypothetical protein